MRVIISRLVPRAVCAVWRICAFLLVLCICLPSLSPPVLGGGVGVSSGPDQVGPSAGIATVPFHLYVADPTRSPLGHRDIEFLWSDSYAQTGHPLVPPGSTGQENDLDRFARALCTEVSNSFSFPFITDIQLVYDYLNVRFPAFRDSLYNPDPQFPGFNVA